jgi:hypothetical protein
MSEPVMMWTVERVECWHCGQEWVAVYPTQRVEGGLECPACRLLTGYPLEPEPDQDGEV